MKFAATTLPLIAVVTQGIQLNSESNQDPLLSELTVALEELLEIDTEIAYGESCADGECCEEGECCDGDDCCSGSDCSDSDEDCEGECCGDDCGVTTDDIVNSAADILGDVSKVTQIDIPEPLEAHTLAMTLDFDAGKINFINIPTEYTDDAGEIQTYDNEQMDMGDLWRKASTAASKSTAALFEAADANEDGEIDEKESIDAVTAAVEAGEIDIPFAQELGHILQNIDQQNPFGGEGILSKDQVQHGLAMNFFNRAQSDYWAEYYFNAPIEEKAKMDADNGTKEIFGMTDKDMDAWITGDEIEAHLTESLANGMPEEEAEGLKEWLNSIDMEDGNQDDAVHYWQLHASLVEQNLAHFRAMEAEAEQDDEESEESEESEDEY